MESAKYVKRFTVVLACAASPFIFVCNLALAGSLQSTDEDRDAKFKERVRSFYDDVPAAIARDCPAGFEWTLPVKNGIAQCTPVTAPKPTCTWMEQYFLIGPNAGNCIPVPIGG